MSVVYSACQWRASSTFARNIGSGDIRLRMRNSKKASKFRQRPFWVSAIIRAGAICLLGHTSPRDPSVARYHGRGFEGSQARQRFFCTGPRLFRAVYCGFRRRPGSLGQGSLHTTARLLCIHASHVWWTRPFGRASESDALVI